MSLGNELLIPKYISASNPKGLRRAMLKNNRRHGKSYNYYQIVSQGNRWFAWYYEIETDIEELQATDELKVGVLDGN